MYHIYCMVTGWRKKSVVSFIFPGLFVGLFVCKLSSYFPFELIHSFVLQSAAISTFIIIAEVPAFTHCLIIHEIISITGQSCKPNYWISQKHSGAWCGGPAGPSCESLMNHSRDTLLTERLFQSPRACRKLMRGKIISFPFFKLLMIPKP